MKILVTGACGYKGSVLVPKLLDAGYQVVAFDIMWFGNELEAHDRLHVIDGDIRYFNPKILDGVDAVIHLASIANDPAGDLNPKLTWEVGALASMQLADAASRAGVKHFIYASSGSVYGLKDEEHVTEDLTLIPISEYNKTKMVAERAVLSYHPSMHVAIVRPATVCGISPRMRFDVAVNMLTMQAMCFGQITVLGGEQTRPNIHIQDVTDLYLFLLKNPNITGIYNAGFENLAITDIASMISKLTGATINIEESNDPRSYRVDSSKLLKVGFTPSYSVGDAINEIVQAFKDGNLVNEPRCHTMSWMKQLKIGG